MITENTDHLADMLAFLPAANKEKPKITLFLTVLARQFQELETATVAVLVSRYLVHATGAQLRTLGKLVGQIYAGETEARYRQKIRARIAANSSDGTLLDVRKVARLIVPDTATGIQPLTSLSRALRIVFTGETLSADDLAVLSSFLGTGEGSAVAAGVRPLLEYNTVDDDLSLLFGPDTTLDGAHSIGATTINVFSTEGYPVSGELVISSGESYEENFTYTSKTDTSFIGSAGLANNHSGGEAVLVYDESTGMADTADTLGGRTIQVEEI